MIQILFFKKEQVFNSICVIQNNDEKKVFTKDILKHVDLDCVFSHNYCKLFFSLVLCPLLFQPFYSTFWFTLCPIHDKF
jgi:hypothetical protein